MSDLITLDDIARLLLDARGTVTFHTTGSCMFPRIRPQDRITVAARRIEEIAVGEIAVYRRDNRIIAHRVVKVGESGGVPYLVTRPDQAQSDEMPLRAADVLGVVTRVERNNRVVGLASRPLSPFARRLVIIHLALSRYINRCAGKASRILGLLQESALYRAIAPRLAACSNHELTLRVPLVPNVNDLYRCFPLSDAPVALLREASRWSVVLSRNGAPAATLTIERDAERRDSWWMRDITTRVRYRGLGFEDRLLEGAKSLLSQIGAVRLCIALPAAPALLRAARVEGYSEGPPNSMILEIK